MSDDALETCPEHGTPVERVFHPVAIHFKGKGFYNTDYGKKSRGGSKDGDGTKSDSEGSKSDDSKKEPAKTSSPEKKAASPSDS
jgi:predicted nucleic acid-binding Zn ribbon protein